LQLFDTLSQLLLARLLWPNGPDRSGALMLLRAKLKWIAGQARLAVNNPSELLIAAACGALVMRARQRLQVPAGRFFRLMELTATEIDENRAHPGSISMLRAVLARNMQTFEMYRAAEAAGRAKVRCNGSA
jgi:hypothetical protein